MTLDQFYEELGNTRTSFKWYLTGRDKTLIRATQLLDETIEYCPITALSLYKTKLYYRQDYVDMAARDLEISKETYLYIVAAADGFSTMDIYKEVREKMIEVLELGDSGGS